MEEIAGYDKELGTMSENLSSAAYMIDDVISSMESYRVDADFSEEELNSLQERDEQLLDLKRKYGPTLDDVKQYYASIKKEYESLHQMVFENESMKKELSEETERVLKQMKELENLRRKKGEVFCHEMTEVLHRLGMPHGRIALHIVPSEEPVSAGLKEMELYFSANPGEPLASMRDIASGGEISRIALAIEVITAPVLEARTLVFDEIDVGISGKAALACAKEILRLGKQVQVLCITHLPQTASIGSRYYHMEKVVENGKTHTTAVLLDHDAHLRDVAQLISGSNSSEAALESARELEKRVLEK
jgi:DNA repair protein RecN (Recombination protein N)